MWGRALLRLADGLDRSHSTVIQDEVPDQRQTRKMHRPGQIRRRAGNLGRAGKWDGSRTFLAAESLSNWPGNKVIGSMKAKTDSLLTAHEFPGKLIVVEGIDGSGKSTQLQLAKDSYLRGPRPPPVSHRMERRRSRQNHHQAQQKENVTHSDDLFTSTRHGFRPTAWSTAFCRRSRPA